jgi:hypothetical protein
VPYTIEAFHPQASAGALSGATVVDFNDSNTGQKELRGSGSNFLDRHSWLPIVFLVLLPFVVHAPLWLLGRSTDPIWFYSGATTNGASSVWQAPFIDPNLGFNSEALGRLAAWDWLHHIVPWWNPYTGIGMPLAGELQPEAFFLPFNLLLLLPEGVLWQQICMQIMAALATYALLRELKISRLAATMSGGLFALNGVFAWSPGPAAVYCTAPFLPMLLWGIERARKPRQGPAGILIIGVAIAWSILAGFPEPAYINGLLAVVWFLYRSVSDRENRWPLVRRAITGWVLGVLIAAPLLIAFADYVKQSDSFAVHNFGLDSLPWAALPILIVPYVFGFADLATQSPVLAVIWGNAGGYFGILVIVMALVGLFTKSTPRGLRYILLAWILLSLAKTFGVQPAMGLFNLVPLIGKANFGRYMPQSCVLALVVLASYGLDQFKLAAPRLRYPFIVSVFILAVSVVLAWPLLSYVDRPDASASGTVLFLAVSLAWSLAGCAVASVAWKRLQGTSRKSVLACLLLVDAAVMFMVPMLASVPAGEIDTSAIQFLRDHQGLSRFYTLGPIQPNYSAYFQIAGIDHNVLPVPRLWSNYVDRSLLPGYKAMDFGITFWPADLDEGAGKQALSKLRSNYLDLGVRYVITDHDTDGPATDLNKVYSDNLMDIWEFPNSASYFQIIAGGPCVFSTLQREHLIAECSSPATLVRRELYMPGWHVAINRKPWGVTQDELFESVSLPQGHDEIQFSFSPPYVEFGWIGCCMGIAGLLWQFILIARGRRIQQS